MNGITAALTGRLGSEPEQRYTRTGKAMLSFSVAVDEGSHQTEQRPEAPETQWVRVTAWEETALALAERLVKGGLVYVEGRLKLDRWEKDGQQRSGLSLSAWTVQPMGAIGRKSTRGLGPIEPAARQRQGADLEAVPF